MLSLKQKILVVDDEPTQRLLLSKMLQSVPHYQVIEADNGLSALEALRKEQIDLIILDVRMPVMDGFETLAAIREDAELQNIPVIMCTAVSEREEVIRILKQGVANYIVKPINKNTILLKVQRVLGIFDDVSDGMVASESHHTQTTTGTYSAVIADEDETFRKIARSILSPYYDVIEVGNKSSVESLSFDKQPQVILLGKLAGTLNMENLLSKLSPLIQREKTGVYRIYSTGSEAIAERGLKYHGKMMRTFDVNLLHSRFRDMGVLPDFTIFQRKSDVVVALKNYYPQTDAEISMLLRAIDVALNSDAQTVRFDLSNWESESVHQEVEGVGNASHASEVSAPSSPREISSNILWNSYILSPISRGEGSKANEANDGRTASDAESKSKGPMQKIASRYIEDIITEFKSLGISIEIVGYTPPEGSSLATLLADQLSALRQEYTDYLTSQIARLQQYRKAQDVEAITSLGQKLNDFGKERGFPQIALLADMLTRESNNNHWDVVEALIGQLSREQKNMRRVG